MRKQEPAAGEAQIWLRYATQIVIEGQAHQLEMSVPVPLGANEETRAQLFGEAEAGLTQLVGHVEERFSGLLQRFQPAAVTPPPVQQEVRQTQKFASPPLNQVRERPLENAQPPVQASDNNTSNYTNNTHPGSRSNLGPSLPRMMGSDASGNLPLPEFIQYIKLHFSLDPKQAMQLLRVKSLSTINRKDALDRLRQLLGHTNGGPQPIEFDNDARSLGGPTVPLQASADLYATTMVLPETQPHIPVAHVFDEEVEPQPDAQEELPLGGTDAYPPEVIQQARDQLQALRDLRSPTTASSARLQALKNVVDSQIGEEQLQELIKGLWSVPSVKKLKIDQVEGLISWAKQDDFVTEVEVIFGVLEEERYARGNW